MLRFFAFLLLTTLVAPRARAEVCDDDKPISSLAAGTAFELKDSVKVKDFQPSKEGRITTKWVNGKLIPKAEEEKIQAAQPVVTIEFLLESHGPSLGFKKRIEAFTCALASAKNLDVSRKGGLVGGVFVVGGVINGILDKVVTHDENRLEFGTACPMKSFLFTRDFADMRGSKMTIGVLKHNLGSQFKVTAVCEDPRPSLQPSAIPSPGPSVK